MTTFSAMETRIGSELRRTSLTTQITAAVLSAIHFYRSQRFTWNTVRTAYQLLPDTEFTSFPGDLIEVDTLVLQSSGDELDYLEERSFHWLDREKEWAAYKSRPDIFVVQANQIRWYPVPEKTYSYVMSYHYALPDVSATASNAWMNEGEELIRMHAKVDMLENIIRGPESFQEAQLLRGREADILKVLKKRARRLHSTGRFTPWS